MWSNSDNMLELNLWEFFYKSYCLKLTQKSTYAYMLRINLELSEVPLAIVYYWSEIYKKLIEM